MARVKIKCTDARDPRRSNKILEILAINDVDVTKLVPTFEGFWAVLSTESELDKIFNNKTDKFLQQNNFYPQVPPELNANRSVLLFRVDNHIYHNTESEIKEEIEKKNEWVGDLIKVHKFPEANIIKISFDETNKALKAMESGLKMFFMKVPQHEIKQDKYLNIMTCYRCYAMEDHSTAQCSKDKSYKICSECSATDHSWRDCTSDVKKCISCSGSHSTMAMRCRIRKDIIANKRKTEKAKETTPSTSYAQAAKTPTNTAPVIQQLPTLDFSSPIFVRLNQAILHSHYMNIQNPGTYSSTFNSIMKAHGLPTLIIPEEPNSMDIITKLSAPMSHSFPPPTPPTQTQPSHQESAMETSSLPTETQGETKVKGKPTSQARKLSISDSHPNTSSKNKKVVKAEDIGLKLHSKESVGWPKDEKMNRKELLEGLKSKKYKYTYTCKELTEEELIRLIEEKKLDLPVDCMISTEDSRFSKIREGLQEDRSPLQEKQRQRTDST